MSWMIRHFFNAPTLAGISLTIRRWTEPQGREKAGKTPSQQAWKRFDWQNTTRSTTSSLDGMGSTKRRYLPRAAHAPRTCCLTTCLPGAPGAAHTYHRYYAHARLAPVSYRLRTPPLLLKTAALPLCAGALSRRDAARTARGFLQPRHRGNRTTGHTTALPRTLFAAPGFCRDILTYTTFAWRILYPSPVGISPRCLRLLWREHMAGALHPNRYLLSHCRSTMCQPQHSDAQRVCRVNA